MLILVVLHMQFKWRHKKVIVHPLPQVYSRYSMSLLLRSSNKVLFVVGQKWNYCSNHYVFALLYLQIVLVIVVCYAFLLVGMFRASALGHVIHRDVG